MSLIRLISPTCLIWLAFAQIALAYGTYLGYFAGLYGIDLSYRPLLMWLFAATSFWLGAMISRTFLGSFKNVGTFRRRLPTVLGGMSQRRLKVFFWVLCLFALATIALIVISLGALPLLAILQNTNDAADFNDLQNQALPGLFGVRSVIICALEVLCALSYMRLRIFGLKPAFPLTLGIVFVLFLTLLDGKRQGAVIFLVMLAVCHLVTSQFLPATRKKSRVRRTVLTLVTAGLVLGTLQIITAARLDAQNATVSAELEIFRYSSLPLINLEYVSNFVDMNGLEFNPLKPLELLLPAKLIADRGSIPINLPEPTSPSGYFLLAWVYWGGLMGIAAYSIVLGFFCHTCYRHIVNSPAFAILYGYLAWAIIASHTYNHFITILFIPQQVIVTFLLVRVLQQKLPSPGSPAEAE